MPDITKCSNIFCPLKDECYRYTSKPSEYNQAYSKFSPEVKKLLGGGTKTSCEYFLKQGRAYFR